jgi:hypothetical protein
MWFDYEPRFLPRNDFTLWLARMLYATGLLCMAVTMLGATHVLKRLRPSAGGLMVIPMGFIGAAITQTLRFPHFSSMKAVFVLPAISVLALCFAMGVNECRVRPYLNAAATTLLVTLGLVGALHAAAAVVLNADAVGGLPGPQWPIPQLSIDSGL